MAVETDLGQWMHFEVLSWAAMVQKYQGLLSTMLHILRRNDYHPLPRLTRPARGGPPLPQVALPPTRNKSSLQTKPAALSLTATGFPKAGPPH